MKLQQPYCGAHAELTPNGQCSSALILFLHPCPLCTYGPAVGKGPLVNVRTTTVVTKSTPPVAPAPVGKGGPINIQGGYSILKVRLREVLLQHRELMIKLAMKEFMMTGLMMPNALRRTVLNGRGWC